MLNPWAWSGAPHRKIIEVYFLESLRHFPRWNPAPKTTPIPPPGGVPLVSRYGGTYPNPNGICLDPLGQHNQHYHSIHPAEARETNCIREGKRQNHLAREKAKAKKLAKAKEESAAKAKEAQAPSNVDSSEKAS